MCSQQLKPEELLVQSIDKSAWKLDNKEWVKARKAQWAELSKKLKAKDKMTNPLLPTHTINYWKGYFLAGQPDKDLQNRLTTLRNLDLNPFFYLWFHPDQSEANLRFIVERMKEFSSEWGQLHTKATEYFVNNILYYCYDGACRKPLRGEDGVFGGLERLYLRLLVGNKTDGYVKSYKIGNLNLFFEYLIRYFFQPGADANLPKLEIVDYYLTTADRCERPNTERKVWWQRLSLQIIYYFDELSPLMRKDPLWQKNAKDVVAVIKDALEQQALSEMFQAEWKYVKEALKNEVISNDRVRMDTFYVTYEKLINSLAAP